jgi:large subunit ribosomal protein L37e
MSTRSLGKLSRGKTHIMCRRCGRHTYHASHKICSYCGFGRSKRMRSYAWQTKTRAGKRK